MGKGYFILLLLLFHSLVSMAQTLTKNYILGRQMFDANGMYAMTSISYYDGGHGLKNEQLLQANYYDNHAFMNGQLVKQATSQNLASNQQAKEEYSKGSLTGTVSMATDGKPLVSVYYHDLRGQVMASKQTMPDDALLSQNMTYSFTKQPLEIISEIFKNGISTTVTQTNSYNKHNDKIETMTLKVGNVTRTVSSYSYDDIGRLVSVKRSGNAGIVKYDYNIRNWLKETKSDRFKQNLWYENTGAYPCFNGNISRMQWQTSKDNVLRGYDFAYDGLNRLEESTYAEGAGMSQNKNRYSENILSYSANGSIERLQRYGKKNNGTFGLIDDLTYSYTGNQIKAISDKAGSLLYDGSFDFKDGANADVEYFYDTNGALIKDLNKGISNIEYDVLGNLKCITFSNGFKTKYVYDAAGNKLRTTHESAVSNTTDYVGNFVFEDGKLSNYLFEGGYCSFGQNQNPVFHYYEKDHLGSIRMVVNENGTIEQVNHYYPFGGVYGDLSYNSEYQKSKYIGKEFDHMHGLDWYDHGARMYDAAKGIWDRMEPLYDKYYPLNPYLYSGNNPINSLDEDGNRIIVWYKDESGNDKSFIFIGQETDELPQNQFVRDFIQAYFYNINNGGGKAMLEAAKSQKDFNLFNAVDLKENESYYQNNGRKDKYVVWQSRQGLLLSNGGKQSAATILEHEFAHYIDDVLNHKQHKEREQTKDLQYDNKEEKRVVTGYESFTARKNNESIRKNHKGKIFPTKSSISIK